MSAGTRPSHSGRLRIPHCCGGRQTATFNQYFSKLYNANTHALVCLSLRLFLTQAATLPTAIGQAVIAFANDAFISWMSHAMIVGG